MNTWMFFIADLLSIFLMCKTLFASHPHHKKWVKHPSISRIAIFFFLCGVYFFYNYFQSATFYMNMFLYPSILVLYAFFFLDENFFACLLQVLLFVSIKSVLPALFGGISKFLDQAEIFSFIASFLHFSEYGVTSFSYDFSTRLLPSLSMIGFYFYLTRFSVDDAENLPFSYWMTLGFTSIFCIIWSVCSFPEYFAPEYETFIRCTVSFGLLTINLMVYYLFYRITIQYRENLDLKVLQQRISLDNTSNQEMNQLYLNLRKIRHDLLNHIGIMDSLLKEQHYEELQNYFFSIQKKEYPVLHYLETGNIAVNALLNRKIHIIREFNIEIHTKVLIPSQSNIEDTDLCTIIGNLLDNSFEAVQSMEHGIIQLNSEPRAGYLVIQVSNSIKEDPLKSNPLLTSTKGNSPFHGLGLKIVKNTVKKYDGMFSINTKDFIFSVKIMLPLAEQN